jgi:hypothetical protein
MFFIGSVQRCDLENLKDKEVIRCQVGVQDPTKIPTVAYVTSEYLMIHEVGILLESVITRMV